MNSIALKARAKINLSLDVISKRADGYHNIETIFHTLTLSDALFIKKVEKTDYLKIVTNNAKLPCDERNIVFRTAKILKEKYSITDGIFIEIRKKIPISAGLGGGSSDCAATIYGIRKLFSLQMTDDEMFKIGGMLGADVPFLLMRGCAFAEGVGDILTKIDSELDAFVCLVKPPVYVSTADVFKRFPIDSEYPRPNSKALMEGIKNCDIGSFAGHMANSLEIVTEKEYPVITDTKRVLLENGAIVSMMSGSGPTVFGLFTKYSKARLAAEAIKNKLPQIKEIFVTRLYNA